MPVPSVVIGDRPLTLADVVGVAGREVRVQVDVAVLPRLQRGRELIAALDARGEPVYGITTGVGKLKDTVIPQADRVALQRNLVLSHAAGVGPPLPPAETRAMMFLLAASLARGHSGVRPELLDLIVGCLNADVLPVVPERGSVGASGDLAPLAHLALALIGEGEVMAKGRRVTAVAGLKRAQLQPIQLEAKEGLALLNGTHLMTGLAALLLHDAGRLATLADVTGAMSLEALMGTHVAFDERIHALRPHPGQIASSANLRLLTADSAIIASHHDCTRVQDAYSLRCMPQVHGAARDAIAFARGVVEREINSVTDNPLIVWASDGDPGTVLSGGNFHGQPLALALDTLVIALAQLAGIAERRIDRLVNPLTNEGLPPFLTRQAGQSGYMLAQYTAAALAADCRTRSHPSSVDSIPTSGLQEDWNSMGAGAALKARDVLEHARRVLAIELLVAAQALDFRAPLTPGRGSRAAHQVVRAAIPHLETDRPIHGDLDAALELVLEGIVLDAAEEAAGLLL